MRGSRQASPMLTGVPSVVDFADLLSSKGADMMINAMRSAASEELDRLQKAALDQDVWVPFADKLTLEVGNETLSYGTDSRASRKDIKRLEYGGLREAPVPVLRKHVKDSPQRFVTKVNEILDRAVS